MLKFSYSSYELSPKFSLNSVTKEIPRPGALLKIEWPDGLCGYADLFPWPELGDDILEKHLEGLKKGRISRLLEQSIWLARKDAQLRLEKKSGLSEVRKIKNHYTVADYTKISDIMVAEIKNQGFTTLKIKVGRDPMDEARWIERTIKKSPYLNFRLDFIGNRDFSVFERLMTSLSLSLKPHIEFAEDPVPYDLEAWREASKLCPLAVDFEFDNVKWDVIPLPFRTVILKPARQDVAKVLDLVNKHNLKLAITSSMDHPVGVAHALMVASEIKKVWPGRVVECGCLTHLLYWPNDFSKELVTQGPCLVQMGGTGIGFDALLAKQTWNPIR